MNDSLGDALTLLPRPARERLARFAAEFENIDPHDYALFAAVSADGSAVNRAEAVADAALTAGPRRDAVRAAAAAFQSAAALAFLQRLAVAETPQLLQSLPVRGEDRVRFVASLERAIVGLVLWDDLPPQDLGALLGPWAEMAERASGRDHGEAH